MHIVDEQGILTLCSDTYNAHVILKALVDNSNIKQLNIFTISCYSGFIQKIGSTLITLADQDKLIHKNHCFKEKSD